MYLLLSLFQYTIQGKKSTGQTEYLFCTFFMTLFIFVKCPVQNLKQKFKKIFSYWRSYNFPFLHKTSTSCSLT